MSRSRSTASVDTTLALPEPSDEPLSCTRPVRTKRNESAVNAVQQEDKTDSSVKPNARTNRGRRKNMVVEPSPEPVKKISHSPIYATIQRNRSVGRTSFATVAVKSSRDPSDEIVHITPKPSTFQRIQSFFRATPCRSFNTVEQQ